MGRVSQPSLLALQPKWGTSAKIATAWLQLRKTHTAVVVFQVTRCGPLHDPLAKSHARKPVLLGEDGLLPPAEPSQARLDQTPFQSFLARPEFLEIKMEQGVLEIKMATSPFTCPSLGKSPTTTVRTNFELCDCAFGPLQCCGGEKTSSCDK